MINIPQVQLMHDQQNGVIKVKVNGENARTPWAYGEDDSKKANYLKEAKEAAFDEACSQCIISCKPVNVTFLVF